jgi:hypothetical protein
MQLKIVKHKNSLQIVENLTADEQYRTRTDHEPPTPRRYPIAAAARRRQGERELIEALFGFHIRNSSRGWIRRSWQVRLLTDRMGQAYRKK